MNYIAIDIGGTKTLLAVFNQDGKITEKVKFPTPSDYQTFLQALAEKALTLDSKENISGIGVGCPGLMDRQNAKLLSGGGNLGWQSLPLELGKDIGSIFNYDDVSLENDANLAGLSEAQYLKNKYSKVYYLTISTGIGGVFVVDGKIDKNTIDTEPGQTVFPHEDGFKTWEKIASGKAVFEKYGQRASDIVDDQIWKEVTRLLAPGIINVARIITPDAFIIGGGMGAHLDKYKDNLEYWFKELNNSATFAVPPLFKAQNPEEAVIYGAYLLAKNK